GYCRYMLWEGFAAYHPYEIALCILKPGNNYRRQNHTAPYSYKHCPGYCKLKAAARAASFHWHIAAPPAAMTAQRHTGPAASGRQTRRTKPVRFPCHSLSCGIADIYPATTLQRCQEIRLSASQRPRCFSL